jgi:hypothetical protein
MRFFYNLFKPKVKVDTKEEKSKLYSIDEMKKRLKDYQDWCDKHPILHFFDMLQCRIINLPGDIKWQWKLFIDFFRRGKRGFGNIDTWNLSSYLAKTIYTSIEHLKANQTGCPCLFNCSKIMEYPTREEKDLNFKKSQEEWNKILDTIIKTFKISEQIAEGNLIYFSTQDTLMSKWVEDHHTMSEIYKDKKDDCSIKVMSFNECKEYEFGFDLFRKYFFNLWD